MGDFAFGDVNSPCNRYRLFDASPGLELGLAVVRRVGQLEVGTLVLRGRKYQRSSHFLPLDPGHVETEGGLVVFARELRALCIPLHSRHLL